LGRSKQTSAWTRVFLCHLSHHADVSFAPRNFLPETIDLTDTAQLAPVFDKLDANLDAVASVADLENWLRNHSEVCAALGESSSLAYIAMTCQTDDEAKERPTCTSSKWSIRGSSRASSR